MSVSITNPISRTGLSATSRSTKPAVAWRETVGAANRTLVLTATTAAREIAVLFGSVGNNLAGTLAGAFTLTGSTVGTAATGTLTFAANAAAGKKVTIGTRVYTFVAALTAANQVLIGASASASLDNLIAAINAAAGAGTTYGTGTVAHASGTAAAGTGDTLDFTAAANHSSYNAVVTTTDVTSASWGTATLVGGVTPCQAEGHAATDPTGDALPSLYQAQGIEVVCHAGALTVSLGTLIYSLPVPAGGVFHLAGAAMGSPGILTLAAAAADTVATATLLYK